MASRAGPAWRRQVFPYLTALLAFAGHLAYGADGGALSLLFAALWFSWLSVVLLTQRWAAKSLQDQPLAPFATAFALVILIGALQLTPWSLGGAKPIWRWAPGALPVGSLDPYATRLTLLKLVSLAAAFLTGCVAGSDEQRFGRTTRAILTVGLAYSVWALVDHATSSTSLIGTPRDPTRLGASFGSSNTAATLFGCLLVLNGAEVAWTLDRYGLHGRLAVAQVQRLAPHLTRPLVGVALAFVCLVLTVSRAGLGATLAAIAVMAGVSASRRGRRRVVSLGMAGAAASVAALIAGYALLSRSDVLHQRWADVSAAGSIRADIFAAHWAAVRSALIGGYGLGAFPRVNTMIMSPGNVQALDVIGAAHNVYIQWLEAGGIAAGAAMLALGVMIVARIVWGAFRHRVLWWPLMGVVAVAILVAVHGSADYALENPSMALFVSLLLGLGVGGASMPAGASRRTRRGDAPLELRV